MNGAMAGEKSWSVPALSCIDLPVIVRSVHGESATRHAGRGRPSAFASMHVAKARPPPAESPITATRLGEK